MNTLTITPLRSHHCEGCGELSDSATGDGAPQPGDLVLCAYCGLLTWLDASYRQVRLNREEWLALPITQRMELNLRRQSAQFRHQLKIEWRHS